LGDLRDKDNLQKRRISVKRFLFVMMSVLFLSVAGGQAFAQDNLETAPLKSKKKFLLS